MNVRAGYIRSATTIRSHLVITAYPLKENQTGKNHAIPRRVKVLWGFEGNCACQRPADFPGAKKYFQISFLGGIYMEQYVSTADLAFILKLTSRRVNQLVDENVIFRESSGKFDVAESVENFFAYKFKSDEKVNYNLEHALFEKAKREKAELDLQERKKKLLKADDVEKLMSGMILTFKARLLNLPTKCASKIIGEKSLSVITEVLKEAVIEALGELRELPAEKVMSGDEADT